jgi:hypothetical protein
MPLAALYSGHLFAQPGGISLRQLTMLNGVIAKRTITRPWPR